MRGALVSLMAVYVREGASYAMGPGSTFFLEAKTVQYTMVSKGWTSRLDVVVVVGFVRLVEDVLGGPIEVSNSRQKKAKARLHA